MTDAPIGIFDSGVGGLTVARAVLDQLPGERLLYLGDTAHVPYGPKPIADVRRYALDCLDRLVDQGVKLLVIACNSASAACLHDARERYSVPVVEVIRPAVRRAVAATRNGRVGVIGTVATVTSGAYTDAFAAAPDVTVTSAACPQFVDFVERGVTSGRALLGLAQSYLEPLQRADVDTLVLGCTHYPMLAGMIGLVMGDQVTLVSSADETAREVYRVLTERDLLRSGPAGDDPAADDTGRGRPGHTGGHGDRAHVSRHRRSRTIRPARRAIPGTPGAGYRRRPGPGECHSGRSRPMKLTVLGCAGSFPGPDSACSAYLVEADGFRLLVDFGAGSLSALQRYATLTSIDAILLSHLHADHVLDACNYVVVRRYAPDGPYPPLPIHAPAGAANRLAAAYGEGPLDDVYTFHDLSPGTFEIGPFSVTVDRMNHPVETFGVRLQHGGRVLAYSADTAPCDSLVRLAQDADLFLCEASYVDGEDNPPDLHLTGSEAGEAATKANVGRLVLTHLVIAWGSPAKAYESAASVFAGPIEIARPGATYVA